MKYNKPKGVMQFYTQALPMDSDINPYLEMHNAPAENMHYE